MENARKLPSSISNNFKVTSAKQTLLLFHYQLDNISPKIHEEIEHNPTRICRHFVVEKGYCNRNDQHAYDQQNQSQKIPVKPVIGQTAQKFQIANHPQIKLKCCLLQAFCSVGSASPP